MGSLANAATLRVLAQHTQSDALTERQYGIEFIRYMQELKQRFDADPDDVIKEIDVLEKLIFSGGRVDISFGADQAMLGAHTSDAKAFLGKLPQGTLLDPQGIPLMPRRNEAIPLETSGNHNALGLQLPKHDIPRGSVIVIAKHLGQVLNSVIRERNGAYGATADYETLNDTLAMSSWRDPSMAKTLETFRAAGKLLRKHGLSKSELQTLKTKIATTRYRPIAPEDQAIVFAINRMFDYTDREREQTLTDILNTTVDHFAQFAELLESSLGEATFCAIGQKDKIKELEGSEAFTRISPVTA